MANSDQPHPDTPPKPRIHIGLLWLTAFGAAIALYTLTAARTIQWQDSGNWVVRVLTGELRINLGLALSHPLPYWFMWLAEKVLPLEPPHALSLVSALFGAITVANVAAIVRQFTSRALPAILASAGLLVAHTQWKLATIPESYTLAAALLSAEAWCMLLYARSRRPAWLVALFAANGLGFANHNLALLTLPVIGILLIHQAVHRHVGQRIFALCLAFWIISASPYLWLVIDEMLATGQITATISSALFGKSFIGAVAGRGLVLRYTAATILFTLISFPNLLLPAAAVGLVRSHRIGIPQLAGRAIAASLAIHLIFVLRYAVVDQYMFILPAYALIAMLGGFGLAHIQSHCPPRPRRLILTAAAVLIALTPALYLVIDDLARSANLLGSAARNKPYRDDYQYLFTPWGVAETSADRLSRHAATLAGDDAVILVQDSMAAFAVRYQLIRNHQPNVDVATTAADADVAHALATGRRIVVTPKSAGDPPPELPGITWRPDGPLWVGSQATH